VTIAPALDFAPGAAVPVGGVPHEIVHVERQVGARIEGGAIHVGGEAAFLRRRVADALRAEARRRMAERAHHHAARLGVKPRAIRCKDTRSRWGSCAPDGTLAFSWRLVMAPDWVLDYVVAHEVAHLRELNHSARFWAHVDALAPQREAAEEWLRRNGPALLRMG
jgi:predicted metal-dependent hydrolase